MLISSVVGKIMGENNTKISLPYRKQFLQWPGKTVKTYIQEQQIVDGI